MRPDSHRTPAQRLLRLLSWKPIAVFAVLATAVFATPSFALVDDGVAGLENGKGNNGRGNGNGGGVLANPGNGNGNGPVKVPDAPRVPDEPARPAPVAKPQAPAKPDPPKPKPKPAPVTPRAPEPDPTPARPQPTPARPQPTPERQQSRPEPKPARPQPTPERQQSRPEPTPARPEPTPDRPASVRTPTQPPAGPSQPSRPQPVPTPSIPDGRVQVDGGGPVSIGRPPTATPAPAGGRAEDPAPRIGGLVDSADRSLGGGTVPRTVIRGGRPVSGGRGGGNGPTTAPVVRAVRQDARGGVTYEVKATGSRFNREVRVPGGVFGAMPAAGIQARQEVAGAMEEGRTLGRAATDSEETRGVADVLSQPLAVVDDVTGGRVSPLVLLLAAALIAVALGIGIRREFRRW